MTDRCRWVSSTEPRVIDGRHREECPARATEGDGTASECSGCLPCPENHCGVCRRSHAPVTCAECVAKSREKVHTIAQLCGSLPTEIEHRGIESEAAMLWGPSANPEAWGYTAMSAMMGRLDDSWLEDCRDEQHPLWVLGYWAEKWRIHLQHHTDLDLTLTRAVDYIDQQMSYMAGQEDPPFEDFAAAVRGCLAHLEDVLSDGVRDEKGAPCVQCQTPMTRVTHDRDPHRVARRIGSPLEGAQDVYKCKPCDRTVSGDHYRFAVGAAYRAHADELTASDLLEQYDVKGGSVRGWASKGEVRKGRKDANGLQLYNVADVIAAKERHAEQKSA